MSGRRYLALNATGGVKIVGQPPTPTSVAPPPFDGAPRWIALHRFARTWDGDRAAAEAHLADLAAVLPPCCQPHWRALLAEHPPELTSADALFVWTVARHNDVNRRLTKPELPLLEAAALYGE